MEDLRKRFMDYKDIMVYFGCGEKKARSILRSNIDFFSIRLGRSYYADKERLDDFLTTAKRVRCQDCKYEIKVYSNCVKRVKGMDIMTVSRILGHESVATTIDYYVHTDEKYPAEEMEKLY